MVIVLAYHKETKYFNSKFDRIPQQLKWLFSEEKKSATLPLYEQAQFLP